jgi:hypothetical protein
MPRRDPFSGTTPITVRIPNDVATEIARRKSRRDPIPGQTSLDELAQEGGLADE